MRDILKNLLENKIFLCAIFLFFLINYAQAQVSLGLKQPIVSDVPKSRDAFAIISVGGAAPIFYDPQDHQGVIRAVGDLQNDIAKVSGFKPSLVTVLPKDGRPIIIGTLGKNKLIDGFVSSGKIAIDEISGKWETFLITTVKNPLPGIDNALVIVGSDKRGTIYGIYELCEQLGVSPWYWWADVPVKKRREVFAIPGSFCSGEPKVRYRGIFINDEAPAMTGWAKEKFGGLNSKMYGHMFELLLRLRGNYLWPAMWGNAFNEDDPENPRLADEYGIVMGTSHHEPMIRSQQEWKRHGTGPWNYATNKNGLLKFWDDGIKRNSKYESLVTLGMRGDGDEPMVEGGSMDANVHLLEGIISDQRSVLTKYINPDLSKIPQVWALYKEVQDYYDHGMKVPDDVTLLWCDDNWGNLRHLPTEAERKRAGGSGIYYHFDYVGGPRSYKWLNTNALPKIWEQMNLAYKYDANRIWIVNVGDLKPMEIPIEFFLRMAWDPSAINKEDISAFAIKWASREFGEVNAAEIADIVSKYAKYAAWRKPELLSAETFSIIDYQEADRVSLMWKELVKRAEDLEKKLPDNQRDAYFQTVLYPCKALGTVTEMYIAVAKNRLFAQQGRSSSNIEAAKVKKLFITDQKLGDYYNHQMANGKWNHMMDQTRIGYTSWKDPAKNIMPTIKETEYSSAFGFGVAVEGAVESWPGGKGHPTLPIFESLNPVKHYIEVFAKGKNLPIFNITASKWIIVNKVDIAESNDTRVWIGIDWDKVRPGENDGIVTIWSDSVRVEVKVLAKKATRKEYLAARGSFGSLGGPIAFDASEVSKKISGKYASWQEIPDYGRVKSAMSVFPVTAPKSDFSQSPFLEYSIYLQEVGKINLDLIVGPTINSNPEGLKLAVSIDGQKPQVLTIVSKASESGSDVNWASSVRDNARILTSEHKVSRAGLHKLRVWMVDPTIVLEKIVLRRGTLPYSYFGPSNNIIVK
jgi:hypothetical protein